MPFDSIYGTYIRNHYYAAMFVFYLVAVLILQVWGFNGPFYYDSTLFGTREHMLAGGFVKSLQVFPQRPVTIASIYLNYVVGGLTPWPFRLVNAVFMALDALLLAVLVKFLFETPSLRGTISESAGKTTAFIVGFFMAIHPVQCHVVLYVWQRAALFASVFYFAALSVYLAVRLGKIPNAVMGYAACFVLGMTALLSKEIAATIPAAILLMEATFFKTGWRKLLKLGVVLCAVSLVGISVLSIFERPDGVGEATGILAVLKKYYHEGNVTLIQVFMTQCRMLFKYISLILLPLPSKLQLISPQLVSVNVFEPKTTLPAMIGAAALIGGASAYLRTLPIVCFGFLFFVITLIPESFMVPQYVYIPYRASLPMAGLLIALCGAALLLLDKFSECRTALLVKKGLISVGALSGIFLGYVTVSTALRWNNSFEFWQRMVDSMPPVAKNIERAGSIQVLNQLGVELQKLDRLDEALALHQKALSISRGVENTYTLLAMLYSKQGDAAEAEKYYKIALKMSNDPWLIHLGLAKMFADQGRLAESEDQFRKLTAIRPHKPEYHYSLGFILMKRSKFGEAVPCFIKTTQLNPKYADAYYQLGKAFLELGKTVQAMIQFRLALEVNPDHVQTHLDMGALTASLGELGQAVDHFKHVLKVEPDNEMARENLQTAMEQLRESKKE